MRNLLLFFKAVLIALFAVSLGVEMVSAAGFPSVKDLYGRYKFSGECSYVDMVSGVAGEAPVPATTDYNMAVLPGESENEVKVLGFFGYGGGVTLTYNQEDGTLKGETPTAVFIMGMNLMVVADAASTGGTVVFNYQVAEKDGKIQITAQNALEDVTIMDMENGIMGMLSYASAYTMTKEEVSFFVEKDKLVTPGYLVLDNGFDEVMEMPLQMSVVGGEAVKAGSSISSRCIKDVKIYSSDGSIHVDGLEDAEICVFDAQGMLVASAHGATAAFNGLKSGLYLVKFGNQTAKVVVK